MESCRPTLVKCVIKALIRAARVALRIAEVAIRVARALRVHNVLATLPSAMPVRARMEGRVLPVVAAHRAVATAKYNCSTASNATMVPLTATRRTLAARNTVHSVLSAATAWSTAIRPILRPVMMASMMVCTVRVASVALCRRAAETA